MIVLNGEEIYEIQLSRCDGHLYNALNFSCVDMPIEHIAHNLAHINRYGGAQPHAMSVGLHSVLVSYMVPESFAYEALMHDATEAVVGDVSSNIKALLPDFREIEDQVRQQMARIYHLPPVESRVVKVADLRARELECFALRGGELVMSDAECALAETFLTEEWHPDQVIELFITRFEHLKTQKVMN